MSAFYAVGENGLLYTATLGPRGIASWAFVGQAGAYLGSLACDGRGGLFGVDKRDQSVWWQPVAGQSLDSWNFLAPGPIDDIAVCAGVIYGIANRDGGSAVKKLVPRGEQEGIWETCSKGSGVAIAVNDGYVYVAGTLERERSRWVYRQPVTSMTVKSKWEQMFQAADPQAITIMRGGIALGLFNGQVVSMNYPQGTGWRIEQVAAPCLMNAICQVWTDDGQPLPTALPIAPPPPILPPAVVPPPPKHAPPGGSVQPGPPAGQHAEPPASTASLAAPPANGMSDSSSRICPNQPQADSALAKQGRQLREAVAMDDVQVVRQLLAEGVNADLCDNKGKTALHYAASHGACEVAEVLLQYGADPNAVNHDGEKPRDEAEFWSVTRLTEQGDEESRVLNQRCAHVLQLLVAHGAQCSDIHLRKRGLLESQALSQGMQAPWLHLERAQTQRHSLQDEQLQQQQRQPPPPQPQPPQQPQPPLQQPPLQQPPLQQQPLQQPQPPLQQPLRPPPSQEQQRPRPPPPPLHSPKSQSKAKGRHPPWEPKRPAHGTPWVPDTSPWAQRPSPQLPKECAGGVPIGPPAAPKSASASLPCGSLGKGPGLHAKASATPPGSPRALGPQASPPPPPAKAKTQPQVSFSVGSQQAAQQQAPPPPPPPPQDGLQTQSVSRPTVQQQVAYGSHGPPIVGPPVAPRIAGGPQGPPVRHQAAPPPPIACGAQVPPAHGLAPVPAGCGSQVPGPASSGAASAAADSWQAAAAGDKTAPPPPPQSMVRNFGIRLKAAPMNIQEFPMTAPPAYLQNPPITTDLHAPALPPPMQREALVMQSPAPPTVGGPKAPLLPQPAQPSQAIAQPLGCSQQSMPYEQIARPIVDASTGGVQVHPLSPVMETPESDDPERPEWNCGACGAVNWGSRAMCNNCGIDGSATSGFAHAAQGSAVQATPPVAAAACPPSLGSADASTIWQEEQLQRPDEPPSLQPAWQQETAPHIQPPPPQPQPWYIETPAQRQQQPHPQQQQKPQQRRVVPKPSPLMQFYESERRAKMPTASGAVGSEQEEATASTGDTEPSDDRSEPRTEPSFFEVLPDQIKDLRWETLLSMMAELHIPIAREDTKEDVELKLAQIKRWQALNCEQMKDECRLFGVARDREPSAEALIDHIYRSAR